MFEKNLKYAEKFFTKIINKTENPKYPVIYKIEIANIGDSDYKFYIGKASKGITRPMKHYPKYVNNVCRKTYENGEIVEERKN